MKREGVVEVEREDTFVWGWYLRGGRKEENKDLEVEEDTREEEE